MTDGEATNAKHHGLRLYWKQFSALLVKRGIYLIRHKLLLFSQFLIPISLTVLALVIFRQLSSLRDANGPRLQLTLDPYMSGGTRFGYSEAPVVVYSGQGGVLANTSDAPGNPFLQAYAGQFDAKKVVTKSVDASSTSYEEYLLNIANSSLFDYQTRYIIGLTASASRVKELPASALAYFQGQSYHAAPVALNAFSNGFLRFLADRHSSHPSECPGLLASTGTKPPQVFAYNKPLPPTSVEYAARLSSVEGLVTRLAAGFPLASNLLLALSYLAASFGLALIHECTNDAKHLQFVSGVKLVPYWLSSYVVDFLIFFVVGTGIVTVFAAFDVVEYGRTSRLHLVAILLVSFAWAVLPEMYLLSRLFQSPASGLVWLTVINMLSAFVGVILVAILYHPAIHQQSLSYRFELLWMFLSPSFSVADGIFMLFENFQFKQLCDNADVSTICLFEPSFPCCLKTCTPFCAYWTKHDISFERGGIAFNLVAMAVQGFIFNMLVFCLDCTAARRLHLWIKSVTFRAIYRCIHCRAWDLRLAHEEDLAPTECGESQTSGLPPIQEDQDVVHHRHLVETTPIDCLKEQACLILRHVSKCYGPLWSRNKAVTLAPAVDRLSVAIVPTECFGLLGINGAGKTTTFRMITGDLEPTEGQIWVNGFETGKEPRQAQRSLGYCPQSDALLPYLTGRETLRLFARLRGLREDAVNIEVDQLLHDLRLSHYANVRVGHYSGGKRRKLSVAVALVGGSPVVCLDEPTAGVDPISRRRVWNLLMRCRRQGRTILLSSHSMEECEALCTRVCIVVNGRLKCLGNCQYLKARFGRGYSLTLQIMSSSRSASPSRLSSSSLPTFSDDGDYADVQRMTHLDELVRNAMLFVEQEFPEARLVDRHQGVVQYHLPALSASGGIRLSEVFRLIESNRAALHIVNYSLSQTTLEQIFIDLVKLQEEPKSTTLHSNTANSSTPSAAGLQCGVLQGLRQFWRQCCRGSSCACGCCRQARTTTTTTTNGSGESCCGRETDRLIPQPHF